MTLRLRRDLVLLALPGPLLTRRRGAVVLPHVSDPDRVGLVLQVGDDVTSVQPHDRVVFDTYAAEDVTLQGWPCVIVPEQALDAVVE